MIFAIAGVTERRSWIPAQGGGPYCSRNSLSQISASRDSAPRWVSCSFCRRGRQRTAAVTALAPPTGAGRRALLSGISARVIPLVQFLPNRTPLVAPRSSCQNALQLRATPGRATSPTRTRRPAGWTGPNGPTQQRNHLGGQEGKIRHDTEWIKAREQSQRAIHPPEDTDTPF